MSKPTKLRYIYGSKDNFYCGVPVIASFMFEGSKERPTDPMAHESRLVLSLVARLDRSITGVIDPNKVIWGERSECNLEQSTNAVYGAVVLKRSEDGTEVALIHQGYLSHEAVKQVRRCLIAHAEKEGLRKPLKTHCENATPDKFQRRVSLDSVSRGELSLTFDQWFDLLSEQQRIDRQQILSKSRLAEVVKARHLLCFFLYTYCAGHSYVSIGRALGRDHTSIIHAVTSIRRDMIEKPAVRSDAEVIFAAALALEKENSAADQPC